MGRFKLNELYDDRIIEDQLRELKDLVISLNKQGVKYYIKGNALLHLIQKQRGYTDILRGTQDIDLHVKEESLKELLNQVMMLYPSCEIKYSGEKPVRFKDIATSIQTIDFNIEDFSDQDVQEYEIDGVKFKGATLERMLKDKAGVISTKMVYRRLKDVIDTYIILNLMNLTEEEKRGKLRQYCKEDYSRLFTNEFNTAMDLFEGLKSTITKEKICEYIKMLVQN